MSKRKGYGKFVLGAAIGAGLGLLFAPKKGEDLRKDLKVKLDQLVVQAKDIDVEEVKKEFNRKVEDIKMGLVDLDKEKALEIAKEKGNQLKDKAQELVDLAVEKGTPVLKKTANDVLEKVIQVSKETQKKLSKEEKK
ncbi:MAG: YtxH domain-containing protein [Bacilli bacterium]|nr:YtxH domain-containing protein [Bacilli bacterium]